MASTASNCKEVSAWTEATQQRSLAQHCSSIQYKALIQGPLKSLTCMNTESGLNFAAQKNCFPA